MRGALDSIFSSRNRINPTAVFMMTDGEITKVGCGHNMLCSLANMRNRKVPSRTSLRLQYLGH